ncbi:DUF6301 family protein [Nocardia sp. CA-151230]|uniref:DUF6301 family protein n=1 Tax=Nocardia sp. CA-151230 TaxID=3239982 RepID=UPI003D8FFB99
MGANFGSWSRADIDRILDGTGWPVHEDRHGIKAVMETDSHWSYVSASTTPGYMDAERWGFGEFHDLSMTQYVAPAQLDRAYAAALEACVRLLGAPPLVGGPDAFATWCRPDITLRLTRSIRYSYLRLGIEPHRAFGWLRALEPGPGRVRNGWGGS